MANEAPSPSRDAPALRLRNVVLDFRIRSGVGADRMLRALDDVSVDIGAGEIVGLVGESGSGKTTLGKTMLGVHRPSAGEILYRGADLASLSPRGWKPFRRDLQMVFQDPLSSFNPRFTLGSSLALPLVLHEVCPKAEIPARVASLLTRVGLTQDHARRYPHELSGGQLQRVAIARAISVEPRVVVADEAVSKLDISVRAQVLNLLKRMNRETGVSLVFITHDLGVARFLCDRVAVMYFGRIVEIGATGAIFAQPRHPYTLSLLRARAHGRDAARAPATSDADETAVAIADASRACHYAARCPRRTPRCLVERPRLGDGAHDFACFNPVETAAPV